MSTILGIIFYLIAWFIFKDHGYILSLNESFGLAFFCVFVLGPGIKAMFEK
jgi:hypothetical protein